jgi:sigma-B regulation protein RsbU (phosphoserine phosphatase)
MTKLLMSLLVVAAAMGFVADLLQIKAPPLVHGFFWPLWFGVMVVTNFVVRIKRTRLVLPLTLLIALGLFLGYLKVHTSARTPIPDAVYRRIVVDAIATWVGVGGGYRLLLSFITSEGLDHVRMHTELSLAHGIQQTLVPTVSIDHARFEVYGKSMPSEEMGGDLIDVIPSDESLLAYIADISGHGLPAGQLMGMLKAAMRMALQFRHKPPSLLQSADRVLPAVKEPDMYATLALLSFDNSMEAEYALAGHPAILHYRANSRNAARLSMEQLPLGLIPGGHYFSARAAYSPGDVFLLLTDGIPEAVNEKDEEFGLDRVEQILVSHAAEPLPQIWDAVMDAARHHGPPEDDQTLLLLRVRESLTPRSNAL